MDERNERQAQAVRIMHQARKPKIQREVIIEVVAYALTDTAISAE